MPPVMRQILDCSFKAMVAVAVMLAVAVLIANPPLDTQSRPLAALLLAVGTLGLVALQFVPVAEQQHKASRR